jgi:hypothetical protein
MADQDPFYYRATDELPFYPGGVLLTDSIIDAEDSQGNPISIGNAIFTSGDTPEVVIDYYREKLGDIPFQSEGLTGSWDLEGIERNLEGRSSRVVRTLKVGPIGAAHTGEAPPPEARSLLDFRSSSYTSLSGGLPSPMTSGPIIEKLLKVHEISLYPGAALVSDSMRDVEGDLSTEQGLLSSFSSDSVIDVEKGQGSPRSVQETVFTSGDTPEVVIDYYREKLGDIPFNEEDLQGSWQLESTEGDTSGESRRVVHILQVGPADTFFWPLGRNFSPLGRESPPPDALTFIRFATYKF